MGWKQARRNAVSGLRVHWPGRQAICRRSRRHGQEAWPPSYRRSLRCPVIPVDALLPSTFRSTFMAASPIVKSRLGRKGRFRRAVLKTATFVAALTSIPRSCEAAQSESADGETTELFWSDLHTVPRQVMATAHLRTTSKSSAAISTSGRWPTLLSTIWYWASTNVPVRRVYVTDVQTL